MFRICFVFYLTIGIAFTSWAQHNLRGTVISADGPLEGATLTLTGKTRLMATSGSDGSYFFDKLANGQYELTCTFLGYAVWSRQIELNGKSLTQQIELEPLGKSLQPVEVKALRAGNLSPFSKTDISKSFIEKNNLGQDIPILLNQTPNVVSFSDAGNGVGYTGLRIRGTDATRINMTINGIPYNDPESQGTFFVNLPDFLSSVTSIQVQRGVGTSSNGAGAFGATLNFSTHENTESFYLEANTSYGSFNTFKGTLKMGNRVLQDRLSYDVRLSHISSDGYVDRASTRLNGAYLSAAWHMPKSTLRANAILGKEKTYQAWYGISAADLKNNRTFNPAGMEKAGEPYDNETDNYWQNHYQLFYNAEWSKNLSFNTAFYLTTGRGYYEQYKADEDPADYGLSGTQQTDLIRQLWLDNNLFGQIFSLVYTKSKNELTWGGGWNVYPGEHFGKVIWTASDPQIDPQLWYTNDAKKQDLNTYLKWQHQLGKSWHLFTDLQYRHVQYSINGFRNNPTLQVDQTWHFFNPKAGITFKHDSWTAYASYAMANKEPNRDDFEAGNENLPKSEQLHNIEAGLQRTHLLPGLQVGLNGYLMAYRDQLVLTGKINEVGAYTRTNLPKSYRLGTEMEIRYYRNKWSVSYSLALSSNRAIDYTGYYDDYDNGGQIAVNYGNTPLAFSPNIVQQATIDWRPSNQMEISFLNKFVGRQYLDNSGQTGRVLNSFFTGDLRTIYNLPVRKHFRQARLMLQVNNIWNTLYEPNGYTFSYLYQGMFTTENYYYPMAGINWMLGFSIGL